MIFRSKFTTPFTYLCMYIICTYVRTYVGTTIISIITSNYEIYKITDEVSYIVSLEESCLFISGNLA